MLLRSKQMELLPSSIPDRLARQMAVRVGKARSITSPETCFTEYTGIFARIGKQGCTASNFSLHLRSDGQRLSLLI